MSVDKKAFQITAFGTSDMIGNPRARPIFGAVMIATDQWSLVQNLLRPIEQGGQIGRTAAIGMQLLNEPAVRSDDFVARRVFSESERIERFASRQFCP